MNALAQTSMTTRCVQPVQNARNVCGALSTPAAAVPLSELPRRREQRCTNTRASAARGASSSSSKNAHQPLPPALVTPFDDIFFNPNIIMKHDIKVVVNKGRAEVFKAWKQRDFLKHFPMLISQGAHQGQADKHDINFYYQYFDKPALEIRWTAHRTEVVEGERIAFKSYDGAPIRGEVTFKPAGEATEVHLHVEYVLPTVLGEHVGHLAVRTDVNRKLEAMLKDFGRAV